MTRTYAAKRLLEHGPLTLREFISITGWDYHAGQRTLEQLIETGIVVSERLARKKCLYRLA